jgi:hypothetical protein
MGAEGCARVNEEAARLHNALRVGFGQLGVDVGKFLVRFMSGATDPVLNRRMPAVGVFFGLTS